MSSQVPTAILQLRQTLQAKFGQTESFSVNLPPLETGIDCLDAVELSRGVIHEIISEKDSMGVGCLVERLIQEMAKSSYVALIDGRSSFEPNESTPPFLWLRCREVPEAMKAADWLLRDGNLPLILLDLQLNSPQETARIPASSWYRLRTLAKETEATLLVFSAGKRVPCAQTRLVLQQQFSLSAFDERRRNLDLSAVPERFKFAAVS